MKTATLPAVRVQPEMRALAESALNEGETLSMFIEDSLKKQIVFRKSERERERDFIARGLASTVRAKETGVYYSGESVLAELREMLNQKKQALKA